MTALIWDEGMSVGIEAIDEDHKQIIAILAKLTSAQYGKILTQEIDDIFTELSDYVSKHFAREEALLEKVSYPELIAHKQSHQAFIDKLPELKQQWLTQDNLTTSESIIMFLHQWIINHILVEDLEYVPALLAHANEHISARHSKPLINVKSSADSCSNRRDAPIVAKLSNVFSKKVTLSQRVFITTFIPVLTVFILCIVIFIENHQRFKNIELVLGLNNVIEQVNDISHSLQTERGLSSGFTSSNYQQFAQQLSKRRLLTDQAINAFINGDFSPEVQSNIAQYLENFREYFVQLSKHRQQVDNKKANFTQTYQTYTQFIEQLLSISEHLIHIDMNSQLANDISAISSVLLFKEYMGQIRAIGMGLITEHNEDIYNHSAVSLLMGKQLNALRVFHYSANNEQIAVCADSCDAATHQQLLAQIFTHLVQAHSVEQRSELWFDFLSVEIDNLKGVTDELRQVFNAKVQQESQRLAQNYYVMLVVLSLFLLLVTLFSMVLNHSIISPVRGITAALNTMAKGQRNIHFQEVVVNDEIGAMQAAYEKLRRKLLQVDIFQAIVNRQKSEIEYRKSQQAHFENLAFTDALTGAVNRHQFNSVLADEIAKADNYQQPLSILLLDIDHFKQVNDTFGHGVGDEVLVMFYQSCKAAVRSADVVARIGGEEFVIILPNTNAASAFQFAERLREEIQQLEVIIDDNLIELTVSIGVSQWQKAVFFSAQEFIADADKLLYQAKKQGRNKVVAAKI
ncbi:hypothetical protein A9Q74_11900 [Colwellia sp. 39_35_sub15_T18]|nr:hypothetical protein A9Q74_11900 [Colwellia sp. 39_35_sub15_T18]